MKSTIVITMITVLLHCQSYAQRLLFTSEYGGENSNGAIVQYDPLNNGVSVLGSLGGNPHYGYNLYQSSSQRWWFNGGLTLGSDGYYYGINTDAHSYAFQVGNHYRGFFYRMNPNDYTTEVLHVFENNNEFVLNGPQDTSSSFNKELAAPCFKVVETSPGVFYGIAVEGGIYSMGGVWKYTLSSKTYKKIGDFDNVLIGHEPVSNLTKVGTDLFGVLAYRSDVNIGHLYKINTTTDVLEYYHNLRPNPPVGSIYDSHEKPFGDIAYDAGSNTIYGSHEIFLKDIGSYGGGVWSINLTNNAVRNLKGLFYRDSITLGKNANGMVQGTDGYMYLVTRNGGVNKHGTLLRYDVNTDKLFKLFDFPSGLNPSGIGLQASSTKIFGSYLYNGGLWYYDLTTNAFENNIAQNDVAELNFIVQGQDVIGRASNGSTVDAGYFFKYNHNTNVMTTLTNNVSKEGRNIIGEMSLMGDTAVLVNIAKGGAYTSATRFCETGMLSIYNFKTNKFTDLLYSTKYQSSGYNYESHLSSRALVASNNKIYYSVYNEVGTNFSVHSFVRCYDLNKKTVSLVKELKANNTSLVGMTELNNKLYLAYNDSAYVISLVDHSTLKTVHTHDASVYGRISGNLLLASNGKLYGVTNGNDPNSKIVIFSLDTVSLAFNVEYQFDSLYRTANIGLTEINGILYGSTNYEGSKNNGFLFSLNISNNQFIKLHDFEYATDGSNFQGAWTNLDGKLYATSYTGGKYGYGTFVSFDPSNSTFNTIEHLTIKNGRSFKGSPLVVPSNSITSVRSGSEIVNHINIYPNPTQGKFVVTSKSVIDRIEIYNLNGELVNKENRNDEYNTEKLSQGVYIIKVYTKDGFVSSHKLIVSN